MLSRWYARLMEAWAGVGTRRCGMCRQNVDRADAVDKQFCSEACADEFRRFVAHG